MQWELIFAKSMKIISATVFVYLIFFIFYQLTHFDCSFSGYNPSMRAVIFFAFFVLVFYARTRVFDSGAFVLKVSRVRMAAACVSFIILITSIAFTIFWHERCSRFLNFAAIPFALAIFYAYAALMALFGDRFLGVFRGILRLWDIPKKST